MTDYVVHPTVVPGDTWTASNQMTYIAGNQVAMWPFTNAGQIPYSVTAARIAALAKPIVDSLMQFRVADGAPTWTPRTSIKGLHDGNFVTFAPDADYSGGNVAGASITLNPTVTSTIIVIASVTCYSTYLNNGKGTIVYPIIAGVSINTNTPWNGSRADPRNEALMILGWKTGVAAGSRVSTLYADASSGSATHVTQGVMAALAFAE